MADLQEQLEMIVAKWLKWTKTYNQISPAVAESALRSAVREAADAATENHEQLLIEVLAELREHVGAAYALRGKSQKERAAAKVEDDRLLRVVSKVELALSYLAAALRREKTK